MAKEQKVALIKKDAPSGATTPNFKINAKIIQEHKALEKGVAHEAIGNHDVSNLTSCENWNMQIKNSISILIKICSYTSNSQPKLGLNPCM